MGEVAVMVVVVEAVVIAAVTVVGMTLPLTVLSATLSVVEVNGLRVTAQSTAMFPGNALICVASAREIPQHRTALPQTSHSVHSGLMTTVVSTATCLQTAPSS